MNLEDLEEHYEKITEKELTLGDLKQGDIFIFHSEPNLAPHIVIQEKYYHPAHKTWYVNIKRINITTQGYDGGMGIHHRVTFIK